MGNIDRNMSKATLRKGVLTVNIEGRIGKALLIDVQENEGKMFCSEDLDAILKEFEGDRFERLRVNIRSSGGSVEEALLIYQTLCALEIKVETICHGYVASAATVIAQAGDVRKITNGTLYLVHRATASVDGNRDEIIHASNLLSKADEQVANIYAERSGKDVELFRELMGRGAGRGEWLSSKEALELGLCDEVVSISPFTKLKEKARGFIGSLRKSGATSVVSGVENRFSDPMFEDEFLVTEEQIAAQQTETESGEDMLIDFLTPEINGNQSSYSKDVDMFRV